MWQEPIAAISRRHRLYLAVSLLLFAYLALVRADTTLRDLAVGGALLLAIWALAALAAWLKQERVGRSAPRGDSNARR